ncbi:PREDICTED: 39S ribosomal protein L11, mitochondrial isoform X1 [Cyphomyrmex costatus]|uniref:39S ribosomal protein L11, mitochondrial isoform X1 n=1 Tax=Cyphomyrmex costatus TaxID=456900 RepID=UPI000852322D|nr:PREDICTED: 39S ribosomal protein L11, mitochondrial isoform X1 [Cyphomyrmex costatus]XP_018405791.1 PREDICTED: 39S ribosomal protein L11, mitochondrial isoform X1 [Cyphomyrmex costatus]
MSKLMGRMKKIGKMSKNVEKIDHSSKLRVNIPAGMASSAPPLGSQLGQRNIIIDKFCKDFNSRTADIKEGIPLPCRVKVKSDRSYDLVIHKPPTTYYLKQAAGIQKGRIKKGEIAGKITLKHLYEIAKIKIEDPPNALLTLEQMCQMIVGIARTCGIEIVREIDPDEYRQFLKDREAVITEYREQLQLAKESKILRTN